VVICNNLEICNGASKHCVCQYQYHQEVINIPELQAHSKCSRSATADGTNVTVPESRSGKTIDKIPVKAWLADALFKQLL
jgi:hypothetical protein